MTTFTVQIPEDEILLFKGILKKLNGKVISADKFPNKETIKAMNELKADKGIKVKNVDAFLKLV